MDVFTGNCLNMVGGPKPPGKDVLQKVQSKIAPAICSLLRLQKLLIHQPPVSNGPKLSTCWDHCFKHVFWTPTRKQRNNTSKPQPERVRLLCSSHQWLAFLSGISGHRKTEEEKTQKRRNKKEETTRSGGKVVMPMMPRVSILKGPPGFGVGLVLVHLQGLVGLEDLWNHRGVDFFLTRENAQGGTKPRVNRTTHTSRKEN